MTHYQELTIIKSPEIPPYFIWSKLFMQVHLALVESKDNNDKVYAGISFPEYQYFEKNGKTITILGSKLRVFAQQQSDLEQLDLPQKLSRLLDYVHIKSISAINPEQVTQHLTVKRYRQDGNMERLTRRFAKRKGISFEDAKQQQITRYAEQHKVSLNQSQVLYENPELKSYPYIIMDSLSSDKKFSLEIVQTEVDQNRDGLFNTYGMSATTTVPHW